MGYVYNYNRAIQEIFETAVSAETGEILDEEAFRLLTELQMERDEKCESVALMVKDLNAQIAACDAAAKEITQKAMALEQRVEKAKAWLLGMLAGDKLKTPNVSVSYRKSSSVAIKDEGSLPREFIREKVIREPDKMAIKASFKEGKPVPGAEIVERQSVIIK